MNCDYCGEECISMYSVKIGNQYYNGHKNCMQKLMVEYDEALNNYYKQQDKNMDETLESLKRDMY